MKIVYVSTPLVDSYGGGEKFIEGMIDYLPREEHVFIGRHPSLQKGFEARGRAVRDSFGGFEPVTARNVVLSPVSYLAGFRQFLRHRRELESADLIVSALSFSELFFLVPWIRRFLKKPVVSCIHNNRCPRIDLTPLVFELRQLWDRFPSVFISQTQLDEFASHGMTGKQSIIIPIGIDVAAFEPSPRAGKPVRIGFLGRLHREKGLDLLIEALAMVKAKRPIEVLIGGEGEELEAARRRVAQLGLEQRFTLRWCGFVRQPQSFYPQLDLFVFPTRRESFGKVMAEAWERGVPTLSSDIPVLQEIKAMAPAAERDLVFPTGSASGLAERLGFFLEHLDAYRALDYQRALHALAEEKINAAGMYADYEQLFRRLVEQSHSAAIRPGQP